MKLNGAQDINSDGFRPVLHLNGETKLEIRTKSYTAFASKLAPTFEMRSPVGASLLAKGAIR